MKAMTPQQIRKAMPAGYELLPIEVIETLIAATEVVYMPAALCAGLTMDECYNAAKAAKNVLARRQSDGGGQ